MSIKTALISDAIALLKKLISTPSFSREEEHTATLIQAFFKQKGIPLHQHHNNLFAFSKFQKEGMPTFLLNSHHDTVKPVNGWQRNPFDPIIKGDQLFGLGSNDAGASLVALMAVFIHFYEYKALPFNLVFLASAEEEISGKNGVEAVLPKLGKIDVAIVGEPTQMQMAIAEKGLLVIDGVVKGKAGHAARNEGENAIYKALQDIQFLQNVVFDKSSPLLGKVNIAITQINAGTQHNVVPDECHFVVDIRTTEQYTNQEVFQFLQKNTRSELKARSFRLNSSGIPLAHPLVQTGKAMGLSTYGSATLSDQALMSFPSLKMGPGNSNRSHTADEYIYLKEIKEGIHIYHQLIEKLIPIYQNKLAVKGIN